MTTPGATGDRRALPATAALVLLLAAAYSGLLAWGVQSGQWNDFAVYYLAGRVYAERADPYDVARPAWDRLAVREGIDRRAYPYRYPPPTAGVARVLLPLTGFQTHLDYGGRAPGLTRPSDVLVSPGIDGVRAFLGWLLLPGRTTTDSPSGAFVARLALGVVAVLVGVSAAALWRPPRRSPEAGSGSR